MTEKVNHMEKYGPGMAKIMEHLGGCSVCLTRHYDAMTMDYVVRLDVTRNVFDGKAQVLILEDYTVHTGEKIDVYKTFGEDWWKKFSHMWEDEND